MSSRKSHITNAKTLNMPKNFRKNQLTKTCTIKAELIQLQEEIQGVPKVRSSNFMHYNFWSKLYFYMKFLEDVYFSTECTYSEFQ